MTITCNAQSREADAAWAAIPNGFAPLRRRDPSFISLCGNFHFDTERCVVATRIVDHHLNPIGIAHGGMLATLVDTAFGAAIRHKLNLPVAPVTVSLNIDYISPARRGDWVEAHVELHKSGRRISNASCFLKVGERLVLRASGTFMMEQQNHAKGDFGGSTRADLVESAAPLRTSSQGE